MPKVTEKAEIVKEINFKRNNILPITVLSQPVLVAGVGATGSTLVDLLVKQGFNNITVCDFDKVEGHNIPNQNYPIAAIGDYKSVATMKLHKTRHGANITVIEKDEHFFESLKDEDLLNGFIVINAIDDFDNRLKLEGMYFEAAKKAAKHTYVETWIGRFQGKVYLNKDNITDQVPRTTPSDEIPKNELSLCGGKVTLGHEVYITAGLAIRELIKAFLKETPSRIMTISNEHSLYFDYLKPPEEVVEETAYDEEPDTTITPQELAEAITGEPDKEVE